MAAFDSNLDADQQLVLDAVLKYPNKEDAAQALGISRATLYRRIQEVEIQDALREIRRSALGDTSTSLQRLSTEAAVTLSVIMKASEAPFSARVAAASKLLDLAYRAHELEDVTDEIAALKRELL
jgi:DNA-binding transcriptional MocR family regulator